MFIYPALECDTSLQNSKVDTKTSSNDRYVAASHLLMIRDNRSARYLIGTDRTYLLTFFLTYYMADRPVLPACHMADGGRGRLDVYVFCCPGMPPHVCASDRACVHIVASSPDCPI